MENSKSKKTSLESLTELLDNFKSKWKSRVLIKSGYIDVTDCFKSKKTGSYKAPRPFGNLNTHKVYLYVIFGAPFISKFKKGKEGNTVYKKGKFEIYIMDDDFRTLAGCACIKNMRFVSLHEIYDAINDTNLEEIQGFKKWALRNIIDEIKRHYLEFKIENDTAFIFAGKKGGLIPIMQLNRIWLGQIINEGSKCLTIINAEEYQLMKTIFGTNPPKPKILAYTYDGNKILPESIEFLKKKFELMKKRFK